MNIVSFDYGKNYIGVAIGNTITFQSIPFTIIKNNKIKFNLIKNLIDKFSFKLLIIGFPGFYKLNSKSYIDLIFLLKKFIINISNIFNIEINLINESYSNYNFININFKYDNFSALYFIKIYFNFLNLQR